MATLTIVEGGLSGSEITGLHEQYRVVRAFSEALCETLEPEDYVIQSMPDASPTKWHLAHTSWFFETFVLKQFLDGYVSRFPQYDFLFNSYYNSIGDRHCRAKRGLISRPTVKEAYEYRAYVDEAVSELFETVDSVAAKRLSDIVTLGLHHEQQHQELMLTDIKHVFSENPLLPVYKDRPEESPTRPTALEWIDFPGGLLEIGANAGAGFTFDNEGPRHKVWLDPFKIGSRLATCGEFMRFMNDGGYKRPELWLSAGWATVNASNWDAPMYWELVDGDWWAMTLSGMRLVNPADPIVHISYYEADAFAQWMGARLPTEQEWEIAAASVPIKGNFVETGRYHPAPAMGEGLQQMYGDVWEWTRSPYVRYPGYVPPPGALGEYNGKFTCDQFVLRGGSCATSLSHIRPTYRNFFPADARWQFMGVRLAKDGNAK